MPVRHTRLSNSQTCSLCTSSSEGPGVAVLLRAVSSSKSMSADACCRRLCTLPAFLLRALPLPMLLLQHTTEELSILWLCLPKLMPCRRTYQPAWHSLRNTPSKPEQCARSFSTRVLTSRTSMVRVDKHGTTAQFLSDLLT